MRYHISHFISIENRPYDTNFPSINPKNILKSILILFQYRQINCTDIHLLLLPTRLIVLGHFNGLVIVLILSTKVLEKYSNYISVSLSAYLLRNLCHSLLLFIASKLFTDSLRSDRQYRQISKADFVGSCKRVKISLRVRKYQNVLHFEIIL